MVKLKPEIHMIDNIIDISKKNEKIVVKIIT